MPISPHFRIATRSSPFRHLFVIVLALSIFPSLYRAQSLPSPIDSDHDGLSDALEQALLLQFVPQFQMGKGDCSNLPAEFQPDTSRPKVIAENGTIYGQVFPVRGRIDGAPSAEIHYYDLWQTDCGKHGHPLDAEHVSVLVQASSPDLASSSWTALYWYAAAHEDTVCDVSQIAHASTLHAQNAGPVVWISPGKHASYLDASLCKRGCGADRCEKMTALAPAKLINLGEPQYPMNGSAFIASSAWPLATKMAATNFPPATLARLDTLPPTQIAWFNPGKHPSQGIIAISSTTEEAITGSVSTAAQSTGDSLSVARDSSGNALQKSYRHTVRALGTTVHNVNKTLSPAETAAPSKAETKSKSQ